MLLVEILLICKDQLKKHICGGAVIKAISLFCVSVYFLYYTHCTLSNMNCLEVLLICIESFHLCVEKKKSVKEAIARVEEKYRWI